MTVPADQTHLDRNLAALTARGVIVPQQTNVGPQVRLEDQSALSLGTIDGRWVRLHSQRDPMAEADRLIAPAFESSEPALIIVIGLGLGYVLDAVERRSPRTKVLALEPAPACIPHMLARRDWTEWLTGGRLRLLVASDFAGTADAWRDFDADASTPPIVVLPALAREVADGVARAREVADGIVFGAKANLEARKRFAGRYLLNTLKNLSVITREGNAGALFDRFMRVPAIIASAGPSLDRNIPALRAYADRALIISVDTALRPLLAAGIDPHLVVAVDPSDINARHLSKLPNPDRTWLVAEGSMDPRVFDQFQGRTFIFQVSQHQPWPWLRELGIERDTLRAWGSVATSAFDLAVRMGCNPIIFAGQDLSYSYGRSYCRGTTWEELWATWVARGDELPAIWARSLEVPDAQPVDDIHGQPVVTTPPLVAFRDWIAQQAALLDGRTVINATGAGILHGPGIHQADLMTVLESLPPRTDLRTRVPAQWSPGHVQIADVMTALTRVRDEDVLTTWASFANTTTAALAEKLDDAADIAQGRVDQDLIESTTATREAASRSTRRNGDAIHMPERVRAYRAILKGEPVPRWATNATPSTVPLDPHALGLLIRGLDFNFLSIDAERLLTSAAYDHAAALFAYVTEESKRHHVPDVARPAADGWFRCLFWSGRFDEALSVAERESLLPEPNTVQCVSNMYLLRDTHERSIAKLERLAAEHPHAPAPRIHKAVRLTMQGHLKEALALLEHEAHVEYPRAICLRLSGDYDAATAALEEMIDQLPILAVDLMIAAVGAGRQPAIEHASRAIRLSTAPVQFPLFPREQSAVVNDALTRLNAAMAIDQRRIEISRISPFALRLFTEPVRTWEPIWEP